MACIKCGGTGVLVSGEACDCGAKDSFELPICLNIPMQYQGVKFSKSFLNHMPEGYGVFMENLLDECLTGRAFKNYIICTPPNSGKTVWAYTLYSQMFAKGVILPEFIDLMQAREIMLDYYNPDKRMLELLSYAPVAVIRLPWDLPNRFTETISTIVERRVRAGGSTIFLYDGSISDIRAKDNFGKLKHLEGDGSFNSVCIKNWSGLNGD